MRRTITVLRSRKIRQSLWYNLVRVWVEHRYDKELRELDRLKAGPQAQALIEKLRRENRTYLDPALVRAETLMAFLAGGE